MYYSDIIFKTLLVRRNYGAGEYTNTSNNRIRDTLAKASSILLDEPFSNDGLSNAGSGFPGQGVAMNNYGIQPSQPYQQRQPMSHGGFTRSNYTASEAGESDFDGQGPSRRRQWGAPLPR